MTFEIEKPKIEYIEKDDRFAYGKFIVEPLEEVAGLPCNALRRVLLSSLPGAAVTSVKFDGVLHEFSLYPGVGGHHRDHPQSKVSFDENSRHGTPGFSY